MAVVAGGGVYGTALYCGYLYRQMSRRDGCQDAVCTKSEGDFSYIRNPLRTEQFQVVADRYDRDIGLDEFVMGINILRRWMLFRHAKGTCLEVGAGTARNLPYYRFSSNVVHRVLLVDSSDLMLKEASDKIRRLPGRKRNQVAVLRGDATNLNILPDHSFDTVIDTFGLCSFDDPVAVLREMARLCKPNGKILLLEHGRSHTWDFVTDYLDRTAENHAKNWGCVWNRDLDTLLEDAKDFINVEYKARYHFGTTYYLVCRPVARREMEK